VTYRVLVIDDDPALRRALELALDHAGYEVRAAPTGKAGVVEAAVANPAIVILDLGLPDLDGVAVCKEIRAWSDVPIIVLSAADAEDRKVAALDAGADDYVTKPFGSAELEARIRAALRHRRDPGSETTEVRVGPLRLDPVHHQAWVDATEIRFTDREFALLHFLARHEGKLCTHQMLLDAVWGRAYGSEHQYLHAYVHRIREKLAPAKTVTIESQRAVGYVLVAEVTAPAGQP
jgi:two-component system, OmpR family, KDP operon response regulator KdpE